MARIRTPTASVLRENNYLEKLNFIWIHAIYSFNKIVLKPVELILKELKYSIELIKYVLISDTYFIVHTGKKQ